ncbi:MAG: S8 family serine peptidase [Chromatiales bacterium]|nr:S8 family serine peptidase [Chromatiales bacterium]
MRRSARKPAAALSLLRLHACLALVAIAGCGGGGGPSSIEVATAVAGGEGSIEPAAQTISSGNIAEFTLVPESGFRVASAAGCSGELDGDRYITRPLTSSCTVTVIFEPITFTLSGSVSVPPGSLVDSDVNDPFAPWAPNDDFATAQPIPNPGTIGGYVNRPGTGSEGRSFAGGDVSDFYVADLLAGQRITLFQGTPPGPGGADLDLFLYDQDGNEVDSSMGTGSSESLEIPATGRYFIEVWAFSGASNYVLAVGQALAPATEAGLRLSDDFVPGEVLAAWAPGNTAAAHEQAPMRARGRVAERHRLRPQRGLAGVETLFELEAGHSLLQQSGRSERAPLRQRAGALREDRLARLETLLAVKALAADPEVAAAEPNFLRHATLVPNDANYSLQWHYPLINLPAAWDLTVGDRDIVVAVIDSGILPGHPDLQGQISPEGFDFISDPERALKPLILQPDPTDPGDGSPGGSVFHGTHVAGTIGAATNNLAGVAGVAWDVTLLPLRVLGRSGVGTSADIRQAVRYAAGLSNASGTLPARTADIINLSLGGPGFSQLDQALFNEVAGLGITVVAAAGNNSSTQPFYPAAYNNVFAVSAVQIDKTRAPYSNFGSWIDLAAPGGGFTDLNGDGYPDGVLSTSGNDSGGTLRYTYAFLQGTSMASPHVAGVFALMKAANRDLGPAQIRQLLVDSALTTQPGVGPRNDVYGWGLIDARRAVEAALPGSGEPDPRLAANPRALSFGAVLDQLDLTLSNAGGGTLQLDGFSTDQPWLSVSPATAGEDGLGAWRVSVSRAGLDAGVYAGEIQFTAGGAVLSIPVLMQVADGLSADGVGQLYILLLDADTGDTVQQVSIGEPEGGHYPFTFSGVPPGEYRLVAGTDLNNDDFICDPGEACGWYLTLDAPKTIGVDADRAGLDFTAGFGATIANGAVGLRRGPDLLEQADRFRRIAPR